MYSIDTMTSLNLGEQGEHLADEKRVDMSPWVDEDNTLRFYIVALRHGETNPYIPATTMEDNVLVWPVTSADTAITGAGLAQFVATDGTRIVKSKRIKTTVGDVIPGTGSDTPPDPASGWVERVINTVQTLTEAAQSAKADAESAAEHAQDVTDGIDEAGAAQIQAVQAKGDEVINSIPADYSTLSGDVTDLKSAIGNKSSLNTDTKTNLVSAINEVNSRFLDGVDTAVSDWLDDHPEATTTVQDGSLTEAKFTDALKLKTIKDYVTPQMFGAKADGITDDTVAIQAAINDCPYGGTVFVPRGTYLVTSISLGMKSRIIGAGWGVTVFKHVDGVTDDMIIIPPVCVGSEIANISLIGWDSSANEITTEGCGIHVLPVAESYPGSDSDIMQRTDISTDDDIGSTYKYLRIHDLYVRGFKDGIFIDDSKFAIFIYMVCIFDCVNYGINHTATDNIFERMYIHGCGKAGVRETGKNDKWSNLKIEWNNKNDYGADQGNYTDLTKVTGALWLFGHGNVFNNIECQSNYGNGFVIIGYQNSFTNCLADCNGYSRHSLEYESVGFIVGNNGWETGNYNGFVNCLVKNSVRAQYPDLVTWDYYMQQPYDETYMIDIRAYNTVNKHGGIVDTIGKSILVTAQSEEDVVRQMLDAALTIPVKNKIQVYKTTYGSHYYMGYAIKFTDTIASIIMSGNGKTFHGTLENGAYNIGRIFAGNTDFNVVKHTPVFAEITSGISYTTYGKFTQIRFNTSISSVIAANTELANSFPPSNDTLYFTVHNINGDAVTLALSTSGVLTAQTQIPTGILATTITYIAT